MLGQGDIIQLIMQGGAVVVLAWILWLFLNDKILSRTTHLDIVRRLETTISEQKTELLEMAADSRKAVLEITASQRVTVEEQTRTIEVLREMVAQLREAQRPPGGGTP